MADDVSTPAPYSLKVHQYASAPEHQRARSRLVGMGWLFLQLLPLVSNKHMIYLKRLTICLCKLKEDPAPAGGAATDVPASELVRFDRFRDGGWVKKLRRGCRDGCRRPRPVTCGTQFAREGAQRESDRRCLSSLVDQPLAQSGCLCVTPNRRFCGNSHLIRRGASFGD